MKKMYFVPAVEVSTLLASAILAASGSVSYDEQGNPLSPSGGNSEDKESEATGSNLAKHVIPVFTFD